MRLGLGIYDIAVVGAGPAGSWTAYGLARGGARVALIDGSHPREKPCGGGITGRALGLLPAGLVDSVCSVAIARTIFDWGGRRVTVPVAGEGRRDLVVASREALDRAVLQAAQGAGAEHVSERVLDVAVDRDGVRVRTSRRIVQARAVIGADGANSLVRRRIAAPFSRDQLSIATGVYARGVTSSEIHIGFVDSPAGYIWSFPRPDHLAIGICAQADVSAPDVLNARLHAWLQRTGIASDAPLHKYAWPIPSPSARALRRGAYAGDRWLLVGDAAGLVDPITREGLYFAFLSGQHAADAALRPRGTVAATYRALLDQEVLPELIHAARLKAGFFRPAFTRLLVDALATSERVRSVMTDLVAGEQSYRSLARRLLATRELGFAWRLAKLKIGNIRGDGRVAGRMRATAT